MPYEWLNWFSRFSVSIRFDEYTAETVGEHICAQNNQNLSDPFVKSINIDEIQEWHQMASCHPKKRNIVKIKWAWFKTLGHGRNTNIFTCEWYIYVYAYENIYISMYIHIYIYIQCGNLGTIGAHERGQQRYQGATGEARNRR